MVETGKYIALLKNGDKMMMLPIDD